jgi:hypothetical protein
MSVSILDGYCDALRTLRCFGRLVGHEVEELSSPALRGRAPR